ncbi:Putative fungistatic metabolite [Cytospora mali]|uniref:Fungistatic metabolite n=1 Tax=Cytospora mali TaxID=578113 RepID=A0A194UV07_CYTMA|nr:Putative fungistatic metabolite [Valsa mali var. pyri (nom. inval.)]
MDPTIIEGGSFGQLWRYSTPTSTSGSGAEQFYAKPLVYTPASYGRQIILAFSEQNRIFALDAVNGTLIAFRDMNEEGEGPFSVAEFGGDCNDISDTIGITGTPIIDDSTETVYFWAKGYAAGTTSGLYNAVYRFHAIDAVTLQERSGYPVILDGHQADNDATRYFQSGIQLQRTSLNLLNGVVYAGFGAHCDLYNYTGWLVGMSASDGHFVTAYATSAGEGAPVVPNTSGAGVWMSGAILASDQSNRFFFSTGNGYTSTINGNSPASGRVTLATLSESVVNMGINSDGTLYQQDYFEPAAYASMDGADRDVGSGGVALLPFSGGGVDTVAVACGKNGQCFVMNADNLGGYKNGANQGDNILQTITPPSGAAMFSTVSCYPLEGGYIYITPSGAPIYAYALGYDSSGRPQFSYAGETAASTTGRVAISATVVTSLDGQEGTGILWIVDPDLGVSAYEAVPVDGVLTPITLPASGLLSKFQRLVFGDGRYYTTSPGYVLAYGSPANSPLNCTGPLNFGDVSIGSSATKNLTCTALIETAIESMTIGSTYYKVTESPTLPKNLTAGQSFTFSVTFNLTTYSADGSHGTKLAPGVKSGAVTITTENEVAEYASTQPISLTGEAITDASYPNVNPLQVDFSPVVVTNTSSGPVSSGASENTFVLANLGEASMQISRYGYTNTDPTDDDTVFYNLTTSDNGTVLDSNGYFTSSSLPAVGSTIAAGSSVVVTVDFNTNIVGSYFTILVIWTTGGMVYVTLEGSAASQPIAKVYYSNGEGGWNLIPNSPDTDEDWTYTIDFGTSTGGEDQTIELLVANIGGSDLIITKSKPPEGTYLAATNPDGDLAEGLSISPGTNDTATVYFEPPAAKLNSPAVVYDAAWTLNVNDLTWGVHVLNFTGTIEGTQVGPKLANGSARFQWLGCYHDSTTSRIESSTAASSNDTNGWCQEQAYEATAAFAGTEYMDECYWGNSIPSSSRKGSDSSCTGYACAGDSTQSCGGAGGWISLWYDVTAYFPGNSSLAAAYQPPSQPAVVGDYYFLGCYGDDTASRALSGKAPSLGSSNTLEACAAACAGYTYFGTEYGDECYCGNTINVESGSGISGKNQTGGCTVLCAAATNEYCGGSARLSLTKAFSATGTVSSTTSVTSTTSTTAATPTASISCPDNNGTVYTALNGATFMLECYLDRQGGDLTTGYRCLGCEASDSGWEFDFQVSFEQYIDLVILNFCGGGASAIDYEHKLGGYLNVRDNQFLLEHNSLPLIVITSEHCTVKFRSVFQCDHWHAVKLYRFYLGHRVINDASFKFSIKHLRQFHTGFVAGFVTEFFYVDDLKYFIQLQHSDLGDSEQFIDKSPLNLTILITTTSSTSYVASSSSTATSTASSTSSAAPAGWTYVGCVDDNVSNPVLQGISLINNGMTINMCTTYCASYKYPLAGVEYGTQCHCGAIVKVDGAATNQTGCTTACGGDSTSTCGGSSLLNVYQSTTQVLPVVVNSTSIDGGKTKQKLQGCFTDGTSNRTLASYTFSSSHNMTVENCISGCKSEGYSVSGVEYSTDCYCGSTLPAASLKANITECEVMMCSGNTTEFCAAASRLAVYA